MISKNKRAAMEMSMGTIVTIVLVVVTLVLALVLIRGIFKGGTSAVTQVNSAIQNQINKLFESGNTALAIYPEDATVSIKRGDSTPAGFAFAVKNPDNNQATFTYTVKAQVNSDGSVGHNCGSGFTVSKADSYDQGLGSSGTISVGPSAASQAQLVRFSVPSSAPACTVTYVVSVQEQGSSNAYSQNVFVTFE